MNYSMFIVADININFDDFLKCYMYCLIVSNVNIIYSLISCASSIMMYSLLNFLFSSKAYNKYYWSFSVVRNIIDYGSEGMIC